MTASTQTSLESMEIDAINAIRFLSIDAIEKANSGHPGAPLALAPLAYSLFTRHMRFDPANPTWPDRDRFVLSNGHASMLLYATLYLCGYDVSLTDLEQFRQWASRTPGHPERQCVPGIEVTTGPLGQGFANAVGLALAERAAAARFNTQSLPIVDHRTWCMAGDGCLMEGVQSEAASLAGLWGLGKLTVFHDDNCITLSGPTGMHCDEDTQRRFAAYGWHVTHVDDINDLDAIDQAIAECRDEAERPSLVMVSSHIGFGSPVQDSCQSHGSPLGPQGIAKTREALGWHHPPFHVPPEILDHLRELVARRAQTRPEWQRIFDKLKAQEPERAAEFERRVASKLPDGWAGKLPRYELASTDIATRKAGGQIINAIAEELPELIGGSADLDPSTQTVITSSGFCGLPGGEPLGANTGAPRDWTARNIEYGVREHAMGAITNGIAAHGMFRPYCATFFVFVDYMRPAVRLAALSKLGGIFVYTHDSVFVGEDGPTHQPVEHLASLRAMPDIYVVRPADANETAQAWQVALERADGPTALVLSRQALPVLDPAKVDVQAGGYVYEDGDDVCLVATGSEVHLAVAARELLASDGISARVVSLPCWEIFAKRPQTQRDAVIPSDMATLAIEAATSFGWCQWGVDDVIAIDHFGASAPYEILADHWGFTPEAVAARARALLAKKTYSSAADGGHARRP